MGTDGGLEQIEKIQSSIDHSLARVKHGLSVQSTKLATMNALNPVPLSAADGADSDSIAKRVGLVSAKMWGESGDSPVNRLLKLHREMSTIRTTAQVIRNQPSPGFHKIRLFCR